PHNQEIIKRSNKNFQWFVTHFNKIKNDYRGRFIAIDNNDVIDSDIEQATLLNRLSEKYDDIRHIFIHYISEKDYVSII
ncbi:MAG: DUF5678 domain-containing protein, partial [Candidatus Nitrosocosmicus sp.]|nr:DUF5678 domain-containing protein [Candidatus Nitrosocosmicus sp.]